MLKTILPSPPRAVIIIVVFTSRYGGIALGNTYGPGTGRIWLDDVVCFDHETDLGSCRHRWWGSNNCQHSNDVSIACQRRNYCTCSSRLWIVSYVETVTNNRHLNFFLLVAVSVGRFVGLAASSSWVRDEQVEFWVKTSKVKVADYIYWLLTLITSGSGSILYYLYHFENPGLIDWLIIANICCDSAL